MNTCPGCGYIVPGAWTECRKCGTPVGAVAATVPAAQTAASNGHGSPPPPSIPMPLPAPPPTPDASFGAPDDAFIAGAKPRGVVPDTMLPYVDPLVVRAPVRTTWVTPRNVAIVAVAVLLTAAGIYSMIPSGTKAKPPPTILAPRGPLTGLSKNLSDVVRVAAESARHTALSAVIDAAGTSGAALTLSDLKNAQPDYQWVLGDQPSTTNTVVSITSGQGIDVIAVSGTDHDICAFGRWSLNLGSDYVTMAHVTNCAATNAPTTGWSNEPGGSAQDLPGVDGN